MNQIIQGRVWCVGDNIDTDLLLPIDVLQMARSERPKHVFRANRPGWVQQVKPGDILIGGKNFGMGSGRPAAQTMKDLGLSCVVADTLNGLFFRNCINFAGALAAVARKVCACFLASQPRKMESNA